ncbi:MULTISPECIES: hypothetical protein [Thiorhodovibrio]|uniref:hypothetical protein n=1 Tax=Thiorhodovibrio TaxID=61593 RepID=UPI0019142835|nr:MULTISPECIES: hypothetical protein [Thiorhodovibrio]WPL11758.1 hypothetical protein Thiosp_01510 [Thiorhodovibrio litoralis]
MLLIIDANALIDSKAQRAQPTVSGFCALCVRNHEPYHSEAAFSAEGGWDYAH